MDYAQTVLWNEILETPDIFSKIQLNNKSTMTNLVKEIRESKLTNFVTVARGASNNAMRYFSYLAEALCGYTVSSAAPSIITLYHGKISFKNSVVVGCSQSGEEKDVVEVIKKGNADKTITIAVTNNLDSTLARTAKYVLYCGAGEQKSGISTKAFNAQIFLLLWLVAELSRERNILLNLKVLGKAIEEFIPELDLQTNKYAEQFKDIKTGYALSRGFLYSLALETSLKFQEICGIQMLGLPWSEFSDGPMSVVSGNTPLLIFCAKHTKDEDMQTNIRNDQVNFIDKIIKLKVPVLLITNDSILNNKYRRRVKTSYIDTGLCQEMSIFIFALFSQMLACKIMALNT